MAPRFASLLLLIACAGKGAETGSPASSDTGDTAASTAPTDADADGYTSDVDCDDDDPDIHPGALEVCNGADDDCDGALDDDDPDISGALTWYQDADGDGSGVANFTTRGCTAPDGYVDNADDCDDEDANIHLGAVEICGGVDEDCDGLIDEADPDLTDLDTWYTDADGDGWGDEDTAQSTCAAPSGTVETPGDCDDSNADIRPDGVETCSGVDDDCDDLTDEEDPDLTDLDTWYADADGDGFGDADTSVTACAPPSGYGTDATDCDDTSAAVYPGAVEVCDSALDNDCDGLADDDDPALDSSTATTWYRDSDGDGHGDASDSTLSCVAPSGYVESDGDCDDTDSAVSPDATETCNDTDDDCDGDIDEEASDGMMWYADADSDGYGDPAASAWTCSQPSGYVSNDDDCDDSTDMARPGRGEVCDGLDNDCDGDVDEEAADADPWYADNDGDGYGDATSVIHSCDAVTGYVANPEDCDDTNPSVGDCN